MLTKLEFKNNLRFISIFSVLRILPLDVDVGKGEVKLSRSWKKRTVSFIFFVLVAFHIAYVDIRLVASFLMGNAPIHHLVLHFDVAICATMVCAWYMLYFIAMPDVFAAVFISICMESEHSTKRKIREHSRQELIALYFPHVFVISAAVLLLAYTYDQTLASLLISSVPENCRNTALFLILLAEELRLIMFIGSIPSLLTFQLHVLFFGAVIEKLRDLRKGDSMMGYTNKAAIIVDFKTLRTLHILVHLFNLSNRYVIFSLKICCLAVCTVSGYSAIRHFGVNPIFGLFYYALFIDLAVAYSLLYEKGFAVAEEAAQTKRVMLRCVYTRRLSPRMKKMARCMIESVPSLGIQVGQFHTLERSSTPNFVGFILQNVVGLLVLQD